MVKRFLATLLISLCVNSSSAQTTPYADPEISPALSTKGQPGATTAAPKTSALDDPQGKPNEAALPASLMAKLVVPVQEGGKIRLLKGLEAWNYLQKKNPNLSKALVRLCESLMKKPNLGPRLQSLFERIQTIHVSDNTLVISLPGSRFLAFDRDNLDRVALFSYPSLSDDELRILENSNIPGHVDATGTPLTGQALFEQMARNNPRALLAFSNLCARLRSKEYLLTTPYGTRTALSMISGLSYQERDRFRATCDPELLKLISANKQFSKAPGHGEHFPTSFKQNNTTSAGGQFCFSPDGKQVEFDIDMYNIAAKNPFKKIIGAIGHTAEVVTPGKTDPYKIHSQLQGQKCENSTRVVTYPDDLEPIVNFTQSGQ